MKLTWKFTAKKANGKPVTGLVVAESEVFAIARVRKMGFTQAQANLELLQTLLTGFGLFMPSDFNLREKARFYETTSRRLKTGGTLKDAFEAAKEYIDDGRLLSAVSIAVAAQDGGEQAWKAMEIGGFPKRDVMVIKALDQMGGLSSAFRDLAAEVKLRYQTENAISKALSTPKFMATFMYSFVPVIFTFIAPNMNKAFKDMGSRITVPPEIKAFYAFADMVNQSPRLWTVLYVLVGIGFVAVIKSGVLGRIMQNLFKPFRDLSIKSEHAQIWTVYGLMYGANINPVEICTTLRPACKLSETSESLNVMGRRISAGASEVSAVEAASFPRFVVAGYKSAKEGGNLPEGLRTFTEMLNEDVSLLSDKLKDFLERASLFVGVALVFLMMYFTYYPVVGPMLQSM
jgi:type II secretory pathway component PulF